MASVTSPTRPARSKSPSKKKAKAPAKPKLTPSEKAQKVAQDGAEAYGILNFILNGNKFAYESAPRKVGGEPKMSNLARRFVNIANGDYDGAIVQLSDLRLVRNSFSGVLTDKNYGYGTRNTAKNGPQEYLDPRGGSTEDGKEYPPLPERSLVIEHYDHYILSINRTRLYKRLCGVEIKPAALHIRAKGAPRSEERVSNAIRTYVGYLESLSKELVAELQGDNSKASDIASRAFSGLIKSVESNEFHNHVMEFAESISGKKGKKSKKSQTSPRSSSRASSKKKAPSKKKSTKGSTKGSTKPKKARGKSKAK